jgi:hypothetical protein
MKQRRRIYYSAAQRSEIWDRWQAGEPMSSIGRRFDRESLSVFSVICQPVAFVHRIGTVPSRRSVFLNARRFHARLVAVDRAPFGTICIDRQIHHSRNAADRQKHSWLIIVIPGFGIGFHRESHDTQMAQGEPLGGAASAVRRPARDRHTGFQMPLCHH